MRQLSKSKIIAFRQCPKRLWLELHRPELKEDSTSTLAGYQVGHTVGEIAKHIYDPTGSGIEINSQRDGYNQAFVQSAELLASYRQPVFEAGFQIAEALAFADVMLPEQSGGDPGWRMVEVKSSTSVKDYHRDDLAIQSYVARAAGVNLLTAGIACVDNSWVYPGGGDYQGLLAFTDLTAETLARADEVKRWIVDAQAIAARAEAPVVETGDHCYDPFECGFCEYCNRGKPSTEFPLAWLPRLHPARRARLETQGITDLRNVPNDFLNDLQERVRRHTLSNTIYFDAVGAAADLAPYGFPAHFLDFESVLMAVPIWKGTRPYQQICFQFSLHVMTASGQLEHRAFLDLSGNDPSVGFIHALIASCDKQGPIYVYNATFEGSRIAELAERFPQYGSELHAIRDRMVDLLPIARNRYYHPSQKGSWSIKAVLPAAVPDLSYETLPGVRNGGMAMEAFCEALSPATAYERRRSIEQDLLAYCRLDTFAMVRLWQKFSGRCEPVLKDAN